MMQQTALSEVLDDLSERYKVLGAAVACLLEGNPDALQCAEMLLNHNGLHANWKVVRATLGLPVFDGTHTSGQLLIDPSDE
jgi:hypothetical protein